MAVTVLVLAHSHDRTARRIADHVVRRRPEIVVRIVSPEDLAVGPGWRHVLRAHAGRLDAQTRLALRDGTVIESRELSGVLNRVRDLPIPQFARASVADQTYSQMELRAVLLSWLASLRCPVVNPATPNELFGLGDSVVQWQVLARRVGLPGLRLCLSTNLCRYAARGLVPCVDLDLDPPRPAGRAGPSRVWWGCRHAVLREPAGSRRASAFVVGDAVWGALPAVLLEGVRRLALAAGVLLLRADFVSSADERGWRFAGADPVPDVDEAAALGALADVLAPSTPPGER